MQGLTKTLDGNRECRDEHRRFPPKRTSSMAARGRERSYIWSVGADISHPTDKQTPPSSQMGAKLTLAPIGGSRP